MLSKAAIRIMPLLLIFVSAVFATAPGWVAKGVVLDYSMGSSTVIFTVTDRTSTDISMDIKTTKTNKATENASLAFGQFWFDKSMLADASTGDDVDEFKVTTLGKESFAGKEWNTITLESTISDAKTTRVYDKDSGLLLKQTVDAEGAPTITLTKFSVPDFGTSAPAPPPAQPAQQTQPPASTANQATSEPPSGEQLTNASSAPTTAGIPAGESGPEEKQNCLSGAVLLTLAGFAFLRS